MDFSVIDSLKIRISFQLYLRRKKQMEMEHHSKGKHEKQTTAQEKPGRLACQNQKSLKWKESKYDMNERDLLEA